MPDLPRWLLAGWWGLVAGSALLIGAAFGYLAPIPRRVLGLVMGFGAGVLISALAFDLMEDAFARGGFVATASGFVGGALAYTLANWALTARGAAHRKRSGDGPVRQPSEDEHPGSGTALLIGALVDGIPESIAIGIGLLQGGTVSAATVVAIFLSNLPEGLSSSVGMRRAGRSRRYVFGVWSAVAVVSALASIAGYALFQDAAPVAAAAITAVAAGGILAMLADTMIPEANAEAHGALGLITVLGFLAAFVLQKLTD
jgi:ZIP family zinc transporter